MSDFYDITHEGTRMVLPRVTSILRVIDKSNALIGWATKLEREAMRAAIEDVLTRPGGPTPLDLHGLWSEIDTHLKGKRAWVQANARASDIGKAAHEIIHWHTKRMLGQIDPREPEPSGPDAAMRAVVAWMDWCRDVDFQPQLAERLVYCPACAYAGTCDAVAKVEGKLLVIDYKTGKAVYEEAHLQVAAYGHALRREGVAVEGALILRLRKTAADPDFEPVPALEVPHSCFRYIAGAWRTMRWLRHEETGSARMQKCDTP